MTLVFSALLPTLNGQEIAPQAQVMRYWGFGGKDISPCLLTRVKWICFTVRLHRIGKQRRATGLGEINIFLIHNVWRRLWDAAWVTSQGCLCFSTAHLITVIDRRKS